MRKLSSLFLMALSAAILTRPASAAGALSADAILENMEAAYAEVQDYESLVDVTLAQGDGSVKSEKFKYTFKKPKRIRIDFEVPYKDTTVIYPGKDGKVVVRPWGLTGVFEFHLSPDSSFLAIQAGQRVDQTDFGLLIANMAKSMKEGRRGRLDIDERESHIRINVLALNHFREGVVTWYRFLVDKKKWLPVEIEESTPVGSFERKIVFHNLKVNIGVPDSMYQ